MQNYSDQYTEQYNPTWAIWNSAIFPNAYLKLKWRKKQIAHSLYLEYICIAKRK